MVADLEVSSLEDYHEGRLAFRCNLNLKGEGGGKKEGRKEEKEVKQVAI